MTAGRNRIRSRAVCGTAIIIISSTRRPIPRGNGSGRCGISAGEAGGFLSTPFDRTAVDFLEDLDVEFYKIASFELVDIPLIEYTASKGKPMIMSCGMASEEEIREALEACQRQGNEQVVLLKCCSQYPAQYEDMNVATIADMKERFGVPVGLSDHSMGSLADVVAVSVGRRSSKSMYAWIGRLTTRTQRFPWRSMNLRRWCRMCGLPA